MTRIVLAALFVALTLPMPAAARDGGGCGTPLGTRWDGGHESCEFSLHGSPLTVAGESWAGAVHVRVTDVVTGTTMLECRATGSGYVRCGDAAGRICLDDSCHVAASQLALMTVRCEVEGTGPGTYWCSSGRGF